MNWQAVYALEPGDFLIAFYWGDFAELVAAITIGGELLYRPGQFW